MSEWKPVEDGERIHCHCGEPRCTAFLSQDGDLIHVQNIHEQGEQYNLYFPDDIRLCRRVADQPITVTYGPHLPPERAIRIALDWAEGQEIITEADRKAALDWLYGQRVNAERAT